MPDFCPKCRVQPENTRAEKMAVGGMDLRCLFCDWRRSDAYAVAA